MLPHASFVELGIARAEGISCDMASPRFGGSSQGQAYEGHKLHAGEPWQDASKPTVKQILSPEHSGQSRQDLCILHLLSCPLSLVSNKPFCLPSGFDGACRDASHAKQTEHFTTALYSKRSSKSAEIFKALLRCQRCTVQATTSYRARCRHNRSRQKLSSMRLRAQRERTATFRYIASPFIVAIGRMSPGVAGLSCATHLQSAGVPYTILEASDGIGGRVRSDKVDGFTLDRGFQIFLTSYPTAKEMLDYSALDLKPFYAGRNWPSLLSLCMGSIDLPACICPECMLLIWVEHVTQSSPLNWSFTFQRQKESLASR